MVMGVEGSGLGGEEVKVFGCVTLVEISVVRVSVVVVAMDMKRSVHVHS